MEQRFGGYAMSVSGKAFVKLLVDFGGGIVGIEMAQTLEIGATIFAQSVSEGKTQTTQIGRASCRERV